MKKTKQRGFTLIELMMVVGIVAIMSALVIGFVGDNVISANRTDGRTTLLATASTLEKCRAVYGAYNNANCSINNGDSIDSAEDLYAIAVTTTAATFDLVATPKAAKAQSGDSDCTSIRIDHLGQQTGSGADPTRCW